MSIKERIQPPKEGRTREFDADQDSHLMAHYGRGFEGNESEGPSGSLDLIAVALACSFDEIGCSLQGAKEAAGTTKPLVGERALAARGSTCNTGSWAQPG